MTIETLQLDKKMLEYSISQFRNIPEYVNMCEAFSVGAETIQNAVDYLSNMINKDKAEGVWLDYIGWLVGIVRQEYVDTSEFFCVNAEDVNVSKRFYFPTISSTLGYTSDLSDNLLQKQINAKISYNVSNGTREDNIRIIKSLVNADKVIIENYSPMMLKISLYGDNIISTNIKERIQNVLAPGVGIYGDVTIYANLSYETIESEINTIVEMSGIDGDYEDYEYVDIDEDLDYILEIE